MQRLIGGLFGLALCLFGLLLLLAPGEALSPSVRERAAGLGITLVLTGGIAIAASLTLRRVDRLWYRKPQRWRMLHDRPTSWRQWWRS